MTIPTTPLSRHDIALNFLEQIKADIENTDIDAAASNLTRLTDHISEWQRSENLKNARIWLDEALQADLLTFDAGKAKDYLQKWEDATDSETENPELVDYRQRVEMRAKQKNEALLIRGVISHSNEIVEQAQTLETGSEPPAPSFMLRQYYNKAKDLVFAARADYDSNPELEQLVQRIERLHHNKETAATVFSMALESQKFSNALNNLDQLPTDFLVPRFTATEDVGGDVRLQYQNMVSIADARQEIMNQAKVWATKVATEAIATSKRYLEAHEPQSAVEELDLGESIEKFLDAEQKEELETAKTTATTQQRNRERAEERAEKALELATSDPIAAWDEYANAYQLYEWADGIGEAYQAVVKALRSRLKGLVRDADAAFHQDRDMSRVRDIIKHAKAQFSNKDASLTELLVQFDEFSDMIQRYEDYIATGNEIIAKVKGAIWDDAVAANDLLTQVESYPEFVLEAFPEIYDLRVQINQRLSADQTYNQLYTALFNETLPEITQAIERTNVAAGEFPNDERFPSLEKWLKYHMAFVSAVPQFERGAYEQVSQLIAPVLNHNQHPDYEAAIKMTQTIQAAKQQQETEDSDE